MNPNSIAFSDEAKVEMVLIAYAHGAWRYATTPRIRWVEKRRTLSALLDARLKLQEDIGKFIEAKPENEATIICDFRTIITEWWFAFRNINPIGEFGEYITMTEIIRRFIDKMN